jgi:hypothetical protein
MLTDFIPARASFPARLGLFAGILPPLCYERGRGPGGCVFGPAGAQVFAFVAAAAFGAAALMRRARPK